jgi:hypothetical protein
VSSITRSKGARRASSTSRTHVGPATRTLATFFEQVQAEDRNRAQSAKHLLAARLQLAAR